MCLFRDSPPITAREQAENDENKRRVVNQGRAPGLQLLVHNREQPFRALAHELFDDMAPFAAMLDSAWGSTRYSAGLQTLRPRIDDPELTPSAQVLARCREQGGFFPSIMQWSQQHKQALLAQPLDGATQARFEASVADSLREQARIEAQEQGSFEDYVTGYFA
jgi:glutamate--cysteine ligase